MRFDVVVNQFAFLDETARALAAYGTSEQRWRTTNEADASGAIAHLLREAPEVRALSVSRERDPTVNNTVTVEGVRRP